MQPPTQPFGMSVRYAKTVATRWPAMNKEASVPWPQSTCGLYSLTFKFRKNALMPVIQWSCINLVFEKEATAETATVLDYSVPGQMGRTQARFLVACPILIHSHPFCLKSSNFTNFHLSASFSIFQHGAPVEEVPHVAAPSQATQLREHVISAPAESQTTPGFRSCAPVQ